MNGIPTSTTVWLQMPFLPIKKKSSFTFSSNIFFSFFLFLQFFLEENWIQERTRSAHVTFSFEFEWWQWFLFYFFSVHYCVSSYHHIIWSQSLKQKKKKREKIEWMECDGYKIKWSWCNKIGKCLCYFVCVWRIKFYIFFFFHFGDGLQWCNASFDLNQESNTLRKWLQEKEEKKISSTSMK